MDVTRPSAVYDGLRTIIDTIEMDPDPAVRLAAFMYLAEKYRETVIPARDKAAYQARALYSADDVATIARCTTQDVYYWCERHIDSTGAPRLGRNARVDISNVIDITKRIGVHRS
jgi:hypothetical protein